MPVVFIPALLCDEQMYREAITALGEAIVPHLMLSPQPRLEASVADILQRAPARLALVGTSYVGNLAVPVALAAPERVMAPLAQGLQPGRAAGRRAGSRRAGGDARCRGRHRVGLVVHKNAVAQAAVFKEMAQRVGGPAGAAQARALGVRREAESRLGALAMPALVLWGEQDAGARCSGSSDGDSVAECAVRSVAGMRASANVGETGRIGCPVCRVVEDGQGTCDVK